MITNPQPAEEIWMSEPTTRGTYTADEAAKILGIGRNLAFALAEKGELPGVRKLGTRIVISKIELWAYLGTEMPE